MIVVNVNVQIDLQETSVSYANLDIMTSQVVQVCKFYSLNCFTQNNAKLTIDFFFQNVLVIHQDQKPMNVMRMEDVMIAELDSMEQNVKDVL